jgi:hypothetical protein
MGSFLRTPSAGLSGGTMRPSGAGQPLRRYENHFSRAAGRQPSGSKSGLAGRESARWCGGVFWRHDAHAGRTPWHDPGGGLGDTSMISICAPRAMVPESWRRCAYRRDERECRCE